MSGGGGKSEGSGRLGNVLNRGPKGGIVDRLDALERASTVADAPIVTATPQKSSWEGVKSGWVTPESTELSEMSPEMLSEFASTEGGTLGRYQNAMLGSQAFDPYGLNTFSMRSRPSARAVRGVYKNLSGEIGGTQERMMKNNGGLMSLGYFQGGPVGVEEEMMVMPGGPAAAPQGLPAVGELPAGIGDLLSQVGPSDVQAFEGMMEESQVAGDDLSQMAGRSEEEVMQLVEETKMAILGTHPDPVRAESAVEDFIGVYGEEAFEQFREGVLEADSQQQSMGAQPGAPGVAPRETIDEMTEIVGSVPAPPMMAARGGKVPEAPGDFSYEAWGSVPPMPMRSGGIVGYQGGGMTAETAPTDPGFSYQSWGGMDQAPQMPMRRGGAVPSIRYQGGGPIAGLGDGMSDSIPANISGQEEVRLSEGEYIVPADAVSGLGNGSTNAGAGVLEEMVSRIRGARTGMLVQPQAVNPRTIIPR